jgi:urease accessory protein
MIAIVKIDTYIRNEVTHLKSAYHTAPFKVAEIREDKNQAVLELMLMSASPGILDGDRYDFEIIVQEDCQLEFSTQSYQRIFTMEGSASQNMKVEVNKNGFFKYLPHPTVPHKNSNYKAINTINLEENATLIWGEILTCGRKLNAEQFEFTEFQNKTAIYKKGKLVLFENLYMNPSELNPLELGELEGFTHQASLIYFNDSMESKSVKQQIDDFLAAQENLLFGTSKTNGNGLIIKILHHNSEKLFLLLKELTQIFSTEVQPVI